MGRCRLLVDAVFGEHIVQVRTLWRVVDHFETFFNFSACHYGLLACSCMQTWRTVRLSIVSTLALTAWISANEIIHANDLDLGSMTRVGAGTALADTAPLETSIEELLLPFEWVLHFTQLELLLLHQLLETVLEFLFELSLFLQWLGFPVFLFLFQVVNLLLKHLNMQLELLLHLDVVTQIRLIILQLRLVLFRGQVQRVEGRSEVTCSPIVIIKAPVAVWLVLSRPWVFLFLQPVLHKVIKFGLYVG